ncbi:MAG: pyridoxamine 5'-phosphate oxidase family protein, partial [Defluviitaleaceae bacterium]|nr:pyridoxamine 5'-phosphate oxidase family protein [Defluviitaleaceae bacterium]
MDDDMKSEIYALRKSPIAYLASVNEEGYPQMKAMMVLEYASLKEHYFSTNTSSKRVAQFLKNPKASVYYCDNDTFKGVLFTGTIEICTDYDTKAL